MSLLFELERMERLAADLDTFRIRQQIPIHTYKRKEGKQTDGAVCSTASWETCQIEDPWNTLDHHRWYRTSITIPESMDQKSVSFLITTGREGGWDATNPQMLFYLDGTLVQGADINHRRMRISDCAQKGATHEIALLVYSGSVPGDLILRTDLIEVDSLTEKVYYDFLVPVKTARLLKNSDAENHRRILQKLGAAADALDLRAPYSKSYYDALHRTEAILKQEFYTTIREDAPLVSAIGHTHIDIAWLWTVEQTREKSIRSFSTVLELMKQYPDYRFMSSQPILYQFVKEQEPELYEEIKERIREGRWEPDGAMWLESDCNLPAGESLVRQIIRGEQFFQEEFGIPSKCLWLPDVFGYSAAIPQILKKCGIPYFLTTKIAWNQFNQLPNDTFLWKGIDGSDVFVFMPTTCDFDKTLGLNISFTDTRNTTTYTGIVNPNMTLGTFKRFQNRDLTENTLMLFGFGDGGGGPTQEMLEEAERLKYGMPGIPRLKQEPEREFFDRVYEEISDKSDMPVWEGELYFEYHRGTLTSMGKNKRNNRKSELLYEQLETLGSLGSLLSLPYPKDIIQKGWDIILLNQFHDIIPGSAIEAVYDQTDLEYAQILSEGTKVQEQLLHSLAKLHTSSDANCECDNATSVFVFNSQGYVRDDVVTVKNVEFGRYQEVEDAQGNRYPVQYDQDGNLLFFAKQIPSVGFCSYVLHGTADDTPAAANESDTNAPVNGPSADFPADVSGAPASPWQGHFSNEWFEISFNDKLQITSLIEKETGCELIREGEVGNHLVSYEDRPMNWDNWDVDYFYQRKPYEAEEISPWTIKENGPVRTVICNTLRFCDSTVHQEIVLYHDLPRIDFHTTADWQNSHVLLRVLFPTALNATRASYEIQYGNVERETTSNQSWDSAKFEVCAHKWADLSEEGLGISLLNDCKYGHSIKNGVLGLTLIKAGTYPNEHADLGHHEFTYSIYPHKNRWKDAKTVEMAYNLNVPLLSSVVEGQVPSRSFVSADRKNVFFEVLKQAENGDGLILRAYENQNCRGKVTFTLPKQISQVQECDLLERPLAELPVKGGVFTDYIKPYEIKTYRIRSVTL